MGGTWRRVIVTRTVPQMLLSIPPPDRRLTLVSHRPKREFQHCLYDQPLHPLSCLRFRCPRYRLRWTSTLPNVEEYERWSVIDAVKRDICVRIVPRDSTYVS